VERGLSGKIGATCFHFLHHNRDGVVERLMFLMLLHREHAARRFSWSHHAPHIDTGVM
jgi:hypothetical protein